MDFKKLIADITEVVKNTTIDILEAEVCEEGRHIKTLKISNTIMVNGGLWKLNGKVYFYNHRIHSCDGISQVWEYDPDGLNINLTASLATDDLPDGPHNIDVYLGDFNATSIDWEYHADKNEQHILLVLQDKANIID